MKIPEYEQLLSAGAAAMNLVHGAHALGFAAQWVTGWIAYDEVAQRILGLQPGERVVAIIHIGTVERFRRSTGRARRLSTSSASGSRPERTPRYSFAKLAHWNRVAATTATQLGLCMRLFGIELTGGSPPEEVQGNNR